MKIRPEFPELDELLRRMGVEPVPLRLAPRPRPPRWCPERRAWTAEGGQVGANPDEGGEPSAGR